MNFLEKIKLVAEIDELSNQILGGAVPFMQRVALVQRIEAIIQLLGGDSGSIPQLDDKTESDNELELEVKKRQKLLIRLKKNKKIMALLASYKQNNREIVPELDKELRYDISHLVSGVEGEKVQLFQELKNDVTNGVLLTRKGQYIAIEPYLTPKYKKTPQVWAFLNWLYTEGYLLKGHDAKPDSYQTEPMDDRNHFTVQRMQNDRMQNVTFQRGEKIKLFEAKLKYKIVTITAISHAERKIKYDNTTLEADWGSCYKLKDDLFAELRETFENQISNYENLNYGVDINYHLIYDKFTKYSDELGYELHDGLKRLETAYKLRLEQQEQKELEKNAFEQRQKELSEQRQQDEAKRNEELSKNIPEYVEMTMQEWKDTHKDFKSNRNGERWVMKYVEGVGTMSIPVKIIKPVPVPELTANEEYEAEANQQVIDPPVDEAGAFYQAIIDGADINLPLVQTALEYAQEDPEHFLLPEASQVVKAKVLEIAGA